MDFTRLRLTFLLLFTGITIFCFGQLSGDPDKLIKWNEKYEAGVLNISPVILPVYNPDIDFAVTAGFLSTFKTKRNNPYLSHSYFPLIICTDFNNHIINGKLVSLFYDDVLKVEISGDYHYREDHYYGIGYTSENEITPGDNTTRYHLKRINVSPEISIRVVENMYVGMSLNYNSAIANELSILMLEDPLILKQGTEIENAGIGLNFKYSNIELSKTSSAVCLNARMIFYDKFVSGSFDYNKLMVEYKHRFVLFSKDRIIFTFKTENNFGDVPWTDMAMLGGELNIMGLEQGKYRNKSMTLGHVEYRYLLDSKNDNKISRHNFVFRFGGGTIYGEPYSDKPVIINMALGYLFKYQPDYFMSVYAGFADESFGIYVNYERAF